MIKQLDVSDVPRAVEIIRASFSTVAEQFSLTEENCPRYVAFSTTVEKLQTHIDWGWLMYGYYEGERLVGYVAISKEYGTDRNVFEIHNLAVLPEYRHKGYGKQLLDFCKEKVKELGGIQINIGIVEENTVLKNWYAENRFIHTGTKKFDFFPFTCGYMEHTIMKYTDKIIQLKQEEWLDHWLPFHYITHNYYDVEINQSDGAFNVSFVKKPYDEPYEHLPDNTDKLFQPWWNDVKAWGIIECGKLIAVIETAVEKWSNRLLVTELWIDSDYRRQGIGTALMDVALKRAKDEKRRAVMLETQSRNEAAIAFYLKYGFSLIGFDSCAYSNNDLDEKEVRLNMGILLEYPE